MDFNKLLDDIEQGLKSRDTVVYSVHGLFLDKDIIFPALKELRKTAILFHLGQEMSFLEYIGLRALCKAAYIDLEDYLHATNTKRT